MSDLKKYYKDVVIPDLMEKLGLKNPHAVPKIEKITVNMGLGEAIGDKKVIEQGLLELSKITNQKAIVTKARKSVAGFKIRAGWPIGVRVTLRGTMLYAFLQKLIDINLPRVRDFRGLNPKSFDGFGNYNLGVREQIIFPEIDYDQITALRGLDIAITTTAKTDKAAFELLKAFKFPFKSIGVSAG